MKRLRLALLALSIAISVPVALLVHRALESAEFERRARQAAVADRVVDEMERVLSDFLAAEERRPAAAYRFYAGGQSAADGRDVGPVRSDLSRAEGPTFVVAHYQLDPDGVVRTPVQPRDPVAAEAAGDWPPRPDARSRVERAIAEVDQWVEPFWQTARAPRFGDVDDRENAGSASMRLDEPSARAPATEQAPTKDEAEAAPAEWTARTPRSSGTFESIDSARDDAKGGGVLAEDVSETKPKKAAKTASAYEALQSFNRGAELRKERKRVVQSAPRSQVYQPALEGDAPDADWAVEEQEAQPAPTETDPTSASGSPYRNAPSRVMRSRVGHADGPQRRPAAPAADGPSEGEPGQRASEERVRVILDPMRGVSLDARRLLLYRTVLVDGVGYRQGLLIDTSALGRWLTETLIAPSGLADVIDVRFGDAPAFEPQTGAFTTRHAFADPFAGFEVNLRVAPLAGGGQTQTIYALVGLLACIGLVGLIAVDRMASVVIEFAERRSNFVAAVSHELKTPLTAIRMYGEMLRDGMAEDEAKRQAYYATITDESERLSRLIDNVLEFSRLERGDRSFSLTAGALGEAVREVADKLAPHVERAGLVLEVEIEAGLPPVRFDPDALTQLVFNLVDNAIKYAAAASDRRIVLRCARQADGRPSVSVRDFGPGIAPRHLKKVFDPFYRGEAELTRTTKGSGIGLALVKDLGESMGARVRGANAQGGGFEVTLDFAPADA